MGVNSSGVDPRPEIKENTQKMEENTTELKKFNKSSTCLAIAMIAIACVQLIVTILTNN